MTKRQWDVTVWLVIVAGIVLLLLLTTSCAYANTVIGDIRPGCTLPAAGVVPEQC